MRWSYVGRIVGDMALIATGCWLVSLGGNWQVGCGVLAALLAAIDLMEDYLHGSNSRPDNR